MSHQANFKNWILIAPLASKERDKKLLPFSTGPSICRRSCLVDPVLGICHTAGKNGSFVQQIFYNVRKAQLLFVASYCTCLLIFKHWRNNRCYKMVLSSARQVDIGKGCIQPAVMNSKASLVSALERRWNLEVFLQWKVCLQKLKVSFLQN